MTGMAERDSTKTPVAAEALIAAAAPLALQRIPRGAPPQLPAAPAPLGRALRGVPRRALSSAPSARRPAAAPERSAAVPSRGAATAPGPVQVSPGGARCGEAAAAGGWVRPGADHRQAGEAPGPSCGPAGGREGPREIIHVGSPRPGDGGTDEPETSDLLREQPTAGSQPAQLGAENPVQTLAAHPLADLGRVT